MDQNKYPEIEKKDETGEKANDFFNQMLLAKSEGKVTEVASTAISFGVPGTLARRRAAMTQKAVETPMPTADHDVVKEEKPEIVDEADQIKKIEEKPTETTVVDQNKVGADISEQEDKIDLTLEKKPEAEARLEDFVEFGADGVIKDEKLAVEPANKFEPPVEPEIISGKADIAVPKKPEDIQLGNNSDLVESLLNAKPIGAPKVIAGNLDKPKEDQENVMDGEADKALAEMSAEEPKIVEPRIEVPAEPPVVTVNPLPPAPSAPVVTMDQTPEAPNAPEVPTISTAEEKNEIPITYKSVAETSNANEAQARNDNGVDERVQAIQDRINRIDTKPGQEVAQDQTTSVEPTIAPPPASVETQTQPEVPPTSKQDEQLYPISNLDPRKAARRVNGSENSSFFNRLSQRFNKRKPTAEELPKAA